jgi:hypothetical protein
MARPKKYNIDETMLEKMAMIHCTTVEIASILSCDRSILSKGRYAQIIAKGKDKGKMTLRRKMFEAVNNGNITMMIWLSKQMLGMTDKMEQDPTIKILVEQLKELNKLPTEELKKLAREEGEKIGK